MRRNNGRLLARQLHLFFTRRGSSSIPSHPHGRSVLSSSAPASLPGLPDADPLPIASPLFLRGLLACRHLLPRPAQAAKAVHFSAAPAAGLKDLVVDGVRSLKISFQRRSGFDPKRLLAQAQYSLRRNWNSASGNDVVFALIGTNVVVFLLWRIAHPSFMRNHFMISLDNFKSGRLHTLITSAFSHSDTDHLLTNMIGLYFFGSSVHRIL